MRVLLQLASKCSLFYVLKNKEEISQRNMQAAGIKNVLYSIEGRDCSYATAL